MAMRLPIALVLTSQLMGVLVHAKPKPQLVPWRSMVPVVFPVPSTCVPLWAECKATDQCCSGMCAGLAASDGLEAGPTVCIAADMSEIAAPSAVDSGINAKPKANPADAVFRALQENAGMTPEDNVGTASCLPYMAACNGEENVLITRTCCSGKCGLNEKWNGTDYILLSPKFVCWKVEYIGLDDPVELGDPDDESIGV